MLFPMVLFGLKIIQASVTLVTHNGGRGNLCLGQEVPLRIKGLIGGSSFRQETSGSINGEYLEGELPLWSYVIMHH